MTNVIHINADYYFRENLFKIEFFTGIVKNTINNENEPGIRFLNNVRDSFFYGLESYEEVKFVESEFYDKLSFRESFIDIDKIIKKFREKAKDESF